MRILLLYTLILFLSSCKEVKNKNYTYQASIEIDTKLVIVNLNWINKTRENIGGIVLESTQNDSLIEIQKYIFYQDGDTIKLSSEFENGVYTYLLKFNEDKQLVISPVFNNNGEGLFGYNFNELVLNRIKPVEK